MKQKKQMIKMEKQTETISFNEDKKKPENISNIHFYNVNSNKKNMKQLLFNAKMTQVDLQPFKTITQIVTQGQKIKKINKKIFYKGQIGNKRDEKPNNDLLYLKFNFKKDNALNLNQKNNSNNSQSNISTNIKERQSHSILNII